MDALGLSMALGTFIAGILLAESEFQHELEIAIEPFKGLLLGLFFISVGMALDLGVLFTHLLDVLLGVLALVFIKSAILYGLARVFGLRRSVRLQFAGVLSQGGEFAFVLFSAAFSQRVLNAEQLALLLVVVTLSMMTTPLLMQVIDRILVRRYNAQEESDEKPFVEDNDPQVIIVGFGRFGQVIGRLLMANKMRITVLERDVSAVSMMRKYGYKVYYGDATELELLRAAGAEKPKPLLSPAMSRKTPWRWCIYASNTSLICTFLLAPEGVSKPMNCSKTGSKTSRVKPSPVRWNWGVRHYWNWACIHIRPTGRNNIFVAWTCECYVS